MENLIRHITKLLSRHNCVILPGIGAFLAHKVPAMYLTKEKVFMPPHRELGFNPNVMVDDALLLSEYVTAENTTYDKAEKNLSRDIASLRRVLSSKGVCCFGELGTFHMNINGEISFVPNENAIDDPENYGLEPLAIPLLSQCQEKTIVIKQRDFSRYIAVAAAVILAFFFVMPVSDSAYEQSMQASIAQLAVKAPAVEEIVVEQEAYSISPIADTVTENIYTEPQEIVAEVTETVVEEPMQEVVEEVVPQNTYSIIVASLPNAQKAQLAITELSRKMKTEYTVVVGDGRHRISVADYSSEAEANEALSAIQSTFPDAWVLTH
ncbi:MAG: SPOR domain-containing protein [Bacteroidaceae bacterium]|nr:SPOR domain-containing protein [Bacteroidaceae bacterium]